MGCQFSSKAVQGNTANFCNADIGSIRIESAGCFTEVQKNLACFNNLLQQESDKGRNIAVTAQVEQYLLKLIILTEKIIEASDATGSWLKA